MATVGQALTAPETGWRRYDDTDSKILRIGSAFGTNSDTGNYNGNSSWIRGDSPLTTKFSFKFKGSKIRIMSIQNANGINAKITIDGVSEIYSCYNSSSIKYQIVAYEKMGLANDVHVVEIALNAVGLSTQFIWLDAIDIDSTGYLLHPTLNQIADFSQVRNLGDCIPCRYTSLTSGQVGSFGELGTCIKEEIPVSSSATPDGLFNWVYVGKDYHGRKKFIADRNIQHSISWNTLNTAGICSEKTLDLGLGNNYISSVRLLTGGISPTDTDNEWDKYIVSSTLGGRITAGDNNIWKWNVPPVSWTSTTGTTSTQRVRRGYNNNGAGRYDNPTSVTSTSTIDVGFRPVLLVEQLVFDKFLIKKDSQYYSIDSKYYDELTHEFIPLTLAGGADPSGIDIDTFGFDSLLPFITTMTKGSDTFRPCDKLNNSQIKYYKKK